MITVEKLEKGTYFDDAFKISFRYDPTTVANLNAQNSPQEALNAQGATVPQPEQ